MAMTTTEHFYNTPVNRCPEFENRFPINQETFRMLKDLAVFDINIFREQMMEDVDTLEYILEEVYSGFESLNKRGLSVRGMLNGVREQLSSTSVMNVAEFFDLICEALQAIRDSHLIFSLPYFDKRHSFCAHSTVYLADVILKKKAMIISFCHQVMKK